mmetsp:Transcript_36384/g.65321  ORF Transcript_36384/g.65321 Transcript_36384/m.65321 type:complete len:814 (+) Transcript_36384:107-2548(+)
MTPPAPGTPPFYRYRKHRSESSDDESDEDEEAQDKSRRSSRVLAQKARQNKACYGPIPLSRREDRLRRGAAEDMSPRFEKEAVVHRAPAKQQPEISRPEDAENQPPGQFHFGMAALPVLGMAVAAPGWSIQAGSSESSMPAGKCGRSYGAPTGKDSVIGKDDSMVSIAMPGTSKDAAAGRTPRADSCQRAHRPGSSTPPFMPPYPVTSAPNVDLSAPASWRADQHGNGRSHTPTSRSGTPGRPTPRAVVPGADAGLVKMPSWKVDPTKRASDAAVATNAPGSYTPLPGRGTEGSAEGLASFPSWTFDPTKRAMDSAAVNPGAPGSYTPVLAGRTEGATAGFASMPSWTFDPPKKVRDVPALTFAIGPGRSVEASTACSSRMDGQSTLQDSLSWASTPSLPHACVQVPGVGRELATSSSWKISRPHTAREGSPSTPAARRRTPSTPAAYTPGARSARDISTASSWTMDRSVMASAGTPGSPPQGVPGANATTETRATHNFARSRSVYLGPPRSQRSQPTTVPVNTSESNGRPQTTVPVSQAASTVSPALPSVPLGPTSVLPPPTPVISPSPACYVSLAAAETATFKRCFSIGRASGPPSRSVTPKLRSRGPARSVTPRRAARSITPQPPEEHGSSPSRMFSAPPASVVASTMTRHSNGYPVACSSDQATVCVMQELKQSAPSRESLTPAISMRQARHSLPAPTSGTETLGMVARSATPVRTSTPIRSSTPRAVRLVAAPAQSEPQEIGGCLSFGGRAYAAAPRSTTPRFPGVVHNGPAPYMADAAWEHCSVESASAGTEKSSSRVLWAGGYMAS